MTRHGTDTGTTGNHPPRHMGTLGGDRREPPIPSPLREPYSFAWLIPPFAADAACKETPAISFFPERGESNEPAKAVCARCLVAPECLQYALDERIEHGIWAGTSARQRRKMRAKP